MTNLKCCLSAFFLFLFTLSVYLLIIDYCFIIFLSSLSNMLTAYCLVILRFKLSLWEYKGIESVLIILQVKHNVRQNFFWDILRFLIMINIYKCQYNTHFKEAYIMFLKCIRSTVYIHILI